MQFWTNKLEISGHRTGVSCDELGPALGPIRFLERTATGLAPRPLEELNAMLGWTFGHPTKCDRLLPGLRTIVRALDAGELAKAMIATQFLQLPTLNGYQARRATEAIEMLKAAPDTPEHPGWPAGVPDSQGGKFMPEDGASSDFEDAQVPPTIDARGQLVGQVERKLARAAIKAVLRRLLTWKRVLRLFGEAASNAVPGLDAVGDAAMVADVAEMAGEFAALRREAMIARAFAEHGPYTLGELRVDPRNLSFHSYDAFTKIDIKKYFRSAGVGYEYHHIIPQASGLPANVLNSTENIIRVPKLLHQIISDEYAKLARPDGMSLSAFLKGKSYAEQREIGLKILRDMGILK